MDDDQIQQMERFIEILERYGASTTQNQKVMDAFKRSQEEGMRVFAETMRKISKDGDTFTATINTIDAQLQRLGNSQKDQAEKERLSKEKQRVLSERAHARIEQNMEMAGERLVDGTTKAVTTLAQGLQSGPGSDFQTVGTVIKTGANIVLGALTTVGDAIQDFGKMIPYIGGLASGAGAVISGLSKVGQQALPPVIDFLTKEIERTVNLFYKASNIGAAFTNGLTDMRNAATANFLNLEQFGEVLVKQRENIARAGLGFEEAVRRAAAASMALADTGARTRLLRLGYSFEEQSELILETMADMRRGGLLQRSSDAEIARQTEEYASNLRVISAVTGEDARERMKQARTASQNMAVQQQILALQQSQPDAYQKINGMIALMPDELRKGFLQMVTLGTVVDQQTNVMMAQTPAIRGVLQDYVNTFNDSTVSQAEAADRVGASYGRLREGLEQSLPQTAVIGQAAIAGVGDLVGGVSDQTSSLFRRVSGMTDETAQRARDSVNGQARTQDDLTNSVVNTIYSMQNLRMMLQDEVLPALDFYADVTEQFTSWLAGTLEFLKNEFGYGRSSTDNRFDRDSQFTPTDTEALLDRLEGRANLGGMDSFVGMLTGTDDLSLVQNKDRVLADQIRLVRQRIEQEKEMESLLGKQRMLTQELNRTNPNDQVGQENLRKQIADITEKVTNLATSSAQLAGIVEHIDKTTSPATEKAYASGGIATGPISGYSATLHGKEAVVPLPDGDSIPVTMKSTTGSGDGQAQMLEVLQRQLDELRNQTGLTYDMIKHLEKGNRTSREILTSSY